MTARNITAPSELVGILKWLGQADRFVEEDWDIYTAMVNAYEDDHGAVTNHREVEDFLAWMDGGDRLRREHDTPYGPIISFYASDYSSIEECAQEMADLYLAGEV